MNACIPVLYLTESKNKEVVLNGLKNIIDDVYLKNVKKGNFSLILATLKEFAIQEAKMSILNFPITDLFDNPKKIQNQLSEIVLYSFNYYSEGTKYNNISQEELDCNLFNGVAAINRRFLINNKDLVFQILREKDLI